MNENDLSVSLDLNEELFGKTTVSISPGTTEEIEFLIPSDESNFGKISLTDHRLSFDNELYFNIPQRKKRKVLILGKESDFLNRIYQKNEFDLSTETYTSLDQSIIASQDLIILNGLYQISKPLNQSLEVFVRQKGNLVIIPSTDIDLKTYNDLLQSFGAGSIGNRFEEDKSVTGINYEHPFFKDVFEKEVYNFQYPVLTNGYNVTLKNGASVLSHD